MLTAYAVGIRFEQVYLQQVRDHQRLLYFLYDIICSLILFLA